jgi:hypothetical protein
MWATCLSKKGWILGFHSVGISHGWAYVWCEVKLEVVHVCAVRRQLIPAQQCTESCEEMHVQVFHPMTVVQ